MFGSVLECLEMFWSVWKRFGAFKRVLEHLEDIRVFEIVLESFGAFGRALECFRAFLSVSERFRQFLSVSNFGLRVLVIFVSKF